MPGLSPSVASGDTNKGAGLVGAWRLSELRPELASLAKNRDVGYRARGRLAVELVRLRPDSRLSTLALVPLLSFAGDSSKETALQLICED